jgi:DNA-binding XRE family transcriptional regulator
MAKHHCRLRKLRKTAKLSQRELAYLIGLKSQGVLSEIEAGLTRPSLAMAIASALVFDMPVEGVFPGMLSDAQRAVLARARNLLDEMGESGSRSSAGASVADIISRLTEL